MHSTEPQTLPAIHGTRRHDPHDRCVGPHAPTAALLLFLAACGGAQAADPEQIRLDVDHLLAACAPLPVGALPDEVGHAKLRRLELLERLRTGPPALGLACQEALLLAADPANPELSRNARFALLDVFAHTSQPAQATAELERLFSTYGEELHMRRHAATLLATIAPQRAIEVLEPVLRQPQPDMTWPSQELMLEAYVDACARAGADAVGLLTDVATGILYETATRHLAVERLGDRVDVRARQALEHVMRQSSGNSYMRLKSAQALRTAAPDDCCEIYEDVLSREVMPTFATALQDLIETYCR